MKALTLISPNAKAIKTNLKKFFGIKALQCKMYNGRMFLVVQPIDKEKTQHFLNDYDFVHATGCKAFPINECEKWVEFPSLMIIRY